MKAAWKGIRMDRVCRDAVLLGSIAGVALVFPIAVGWATSPKDAAAIAEARERTEEAEVDTRRRAIEAELKTLRRHPWAGSYYQGDGLGANIRLVLAPGNGISATWNGCLGLYGANAGAVVQEPDGQLDFQFKRPNTDRFGGFPDRAIPIRWGERRYLVPPSKMPDFIAAINQGIEPRPGAWGGFFLAEGDEDKPIAGLPQLPAEYRNRIRTRSLSARILQVEPLADQDRFEDICNKRYRLHFEVADRGELHAGEQLRIDAPSNAYGDVVVEDATPGLAMGVASLMERNCRKPEHVPDRHWLFSTGAFDPAAANRAIGESAKDRRAR